jgi:serine O-acetyltransferase
MTDNLDSRKTDKLSRAIIKTYQGGTGINFIDTQNLPVRSQIITLIELFTELVFPGYTGKKEITKDNVKYITGDIICEIRTKLTEQIEKALQYRWQLENKGKKKNFARKSEDAAEYVLEKIPYIREMLKSDVQAAFEGDPAAKSYEEIVLSYPCITAIAVYRIAHQLYIKEIPLIPRIMTEWAHEKTGIDINPGAEIGKNFFIDHGTGVVIGETTVIGNNVKIYQGTTLGALSFPKDERGRIIKGGKRHPTIEDNVTIYAEATILGDIVIGRNSVVGGNVWIKESVPAGVTVMTPQPELIYKEHKKKRK